MLTDAACQSQLELCLSMKIGIKSLSNFIYCEMLHFFPLEFIVIFARFIC